MTRRNDRARTAAPSRKYVAPMPELGALEAELRGRRGGTSLTAGPERAFLAFVGSNPGVTIKETIHARPAGLTYRGAEEMVRSLLSEGRLLAEPPQTRSSNTRLYVADTATEGN